MSVRPDDIANLCALYSVLRTNRVMPSELEKYVQKSMLIDSTSSASQVIQEATNSGLLILKHSGYFLTEQGKKLGKLQKEVKHEISEQAKNLLIKKVYLNVDTGSACCYHFLTSFRVDTLLSTFVFDRQQDESYDERQWLLKLSRVGLLEVDTERAKVNRKYLDVVNDLLRKIRDGLVDEDSNFTNDRNKIGDIAEKYALEYEKKRLKKNGHHDLAMLVQRISLVDRSAGYDILSYRGTGKTSDSPIFIEVKGTRKHEVDFIWSRNERRVAKQKLRSYWIYAFTNVEVDGESAKGPTRINDPIVNLTLRGFIVEPLNVHVRR